MAQLERHHGQKLYKEPSQRVYSYPKTSCDCAGCPAREPPRKGVPTNLALRGCPPPTSGCIPRRVVDINDSPVQKSGLKLLNPQAYLDSYAKGYQAVPCDTGCGSSSSSPAYASSDPRLYSASHGQYLTLDRPPLSSATPLRELYSERLRGYGQNYRTYSDVSSGNVLYYVDRSREDPYYSPLFTGKARVGTVIYKDPMGGIHTEYPRKVTNLPTTGDTACDTVGGGGATGQDAANKDGFCLTWLRDTQRHREDIMASQMAKANSQRWSSRWAGR